MTAPHITSQALRLLADQIQAPDDVPALCLREAADLIDRLATAADPDALVIAHSVGYHSRDDEVRGLRAQLERLAHAARAACDSWDAPEFVPGEMDVKMTMLRNCVDKLEKK